MDNKHGLCFPPICLKRSTTSLERPCLNEFPAGDQRRRYCCCSALSWHVFLSRCAATRTHNSSGAALSNNLASRVAAVQPSAIPMLRLLGHSVSCSSPPNMLWALHVDRHMSEAPCSNMSAGGAQVIFAENAAQSCVAVAVKDAKPGSIA
jgi:hypothetical protein